MRQRIEKVIIEYVLLVGMSFSLTYGVVGCFGVVAHPLHVLSIALIGGILISVIGFNKLTFGITLGSVGVIGVSVWGYLVLTGQLQEQIAVIQELGKNGIGQAHMSTCMTVVVVVLAYILISKYAGFYPLLIIGGTVYLMQFLEKGVDYVNGFNALVLTGIFYYFYKYFHQIQHERENGHEMRLIPFIKATWGLGLGVFLVALGMAYATPLRFEVFHRMFDTQELPTTPYYFPYGGVLGGDIKLNDDVVLEVMGEEGLYLASIYKEYYTGEKWEIERSQVIPVGAPLLMDTIESLWAIRNLWEIEEDEVFDSYTVSVMFRGILSKYLFVPFKSGGITFYQSTPEMYVREDSILLGESVSSGFRYEATTHIPKYNESLVEALLRKSKLGIYKERVKESNDGMLKMLVERADRIRQIYTQLPDTLPTRVKELAYEITENYDNDYDRARALEDYLASHYSYTLSPGSVPLEADFVDYFLFEKKEGYCTYFATSMAVLGRCIGLPTRYVEGYKVGAEYDKETQAYLVSNKQAHAWVEVYLEGFGWVAFEPTASYQEDFRRRVERADYQMPNRIEDEINQEKVIEGEKHTRDLQKILCLLTTIIGLGTVSLSLGILGIKAYKRQKMRQMNPRDAILLFYPRYLKKLAVKGMPLQRGETLSAYSRRVDRVLGEEIHHFEAVTESFLLARYSDEMITREDQERVLSFYKIFLKLLRKKRHL